MKENVSEVQTARITWRVQSAKTFCFVQSLLLLRCVRSLAPSSHVPVRQAGTKPSIGGLQVLHFFVLSDVEDDRIVLSINQAILYLAKYVGPLDIMA